MSKYIVWTKNGCEGWTPEEYNTLEQAIKHESYGQDKIITRKVEWKIIEKNE